ncbi:hypothetical protein [Streptomyces canus]|uniref:hypothetical protein n=1 Tax=Streptomyces canus TaxID=58343 RepID=UPI0038649FEF|nr:hypothetical protein OH824_14100 [Streptomyces canus]
MTTNPTPDPTAAVEVFARLLCAADVHVHGDEHPTWQQLSTERGRSVQAHYREAARWLLPRMTAPAASAVVAVAVPPTGQTALRDRIAETLALRENGPASDGRGWFRDEEQRQSFVTDADAVLAVLPPPADRAAALTDAERAMLNYALNQAQLRLWRHGPATEEDQSALNSLRRLADEAQQQPETDAVVPPPALTEVGRLRAQVEVLQQDAERDRGLVKVGARCMREGHQGLIESGRAVLGGWRFALSTALGLGTGAPWEAIHERVKELAAAPAVVSAVPPQPEETRPGAYVHDPELPAIEPEPLGNIDVDPADVAEASEEAVHGCPPDGSGLTPCCGRTPFELPLTDRISSEAPITCPGSAS